MIDSRSIFGFFADSKTPDRLDRSDPTDKKEGHEINSFKGNLSKNVKFQKYSAKSIVFQVFWIQK